MLLIVCVLISVVSFALLMKSLYVKREAFSYKDFCVKAYKKQHSEVLQDIHIIRHEPKINFLHLCL